jgi:transcriptional regulator with XRE-family HTH domain
MNADTLKSVQNRIDEIGSQSALARRLGVSQGTISDIVNGRTAHVSLRTENKVRAALGLPPIVLHTVPACPDCGSVHVGRCKGRAVEVRPVRPRKPVTRWADAPTKQLAAAIIHRQEYP